jgi:hypothetical protein
MYAYKNQQYYLLFTQYEAEVWRGKFQLFGICVFLYRMIVKDHYV